MADNYTAGSYSFASDDISSVHYARIKPVHGADGSATDVSTASPLPVQVIGQAANGHSVYRSLDLDESEEEVKATPGTLYGFWVCNRATSTRYVKFYNATAANTTVGTTQPLLTIPIPGNSADDVTGVFQAFGGIKFDVAISAAATTGIADNDTGAPDANDVVINIFFV